MPAGWIPACCNSHHALTAGCSANDPVTTSSAGALPTLPPLSQSSRQLRFIHPEMHDRPFQELVGVARHERRRPIEFVHRSEERRVGKDSRSSCKTDKT